MSAYQTTLDVSWVGCPNVEPLSEIWRNAESRKTRRNEFREVSVEVVADEGECGLRTPRGSREEVRILTYWRQKDNGRRKRN